MTLSDTVTQSEEPPRLTATVGPHGRVVIPAEFRKRLRIEQGSVLTFTEHDGDLIVTDRRTAVRRLQELFAENLKPGEDPVAELIRERREEARREAEWMNA